MSSHLKSRSEFLEIRGLRYHVRHWGEEDAPPIFLLHGWMDSSPSFQFVVDSFQQKWHLIAPDWRGYGQSEWLNHPYWFPDYYGDLDALLAHYSPDQPARLLGHSMGAAIAAAYSGARSERVAQLVMLDFLGLQATETAAAPQQLTQWLDHLNNTPRLNFHANYAALALRLQQANQRLTDDRADFLSRALSRKLPDGRVQMACDPWHRTPSPALYKLEEHMAYWRAIEAPVLMLIATNGFIDERLGTNPNERARRLTAFRHLQVEMIRDSGHNIQHDQPAAVAKLLEAFLTRN